MKLRRPLKAGDSGYDVEGMKRSILRFRNLGELPEFNEKPTKVRQMFQKEWTPRVKQVEKAAGHPQNGIFNQPDFDWLDDKDYVDAYAKHLFEVDQQLNAPRVVNPIVKGVVVSVCQGLHETGGLPGNWAVDLCAAPLTAILAAEEGYISRISGSPPSHDHPDDSGVFGYTLYVDTKAGYRYFVTHFGTYNVQLGDKVYPGTLLGRIGDQHFRVDHCHYGVSSTLGEAAARKRILEVVRAPQVPILP